jgi:hypothetical protein
MSLTFRLTAGRRRTVLRLESFEERTVPAVAIGANFTGGSSSNFAPPDTDGAIGPNNYVQFINGRFAVYTKTGSLVLARSDTSFWNTAGISTAITSAGLSDTRVLFDPLSSHWFAVEINTASSANQVLLARSDTTDPSGTWKATNYSGAASGTFADYPTLGVDANGVYVGTNNFNASTHSDSGVSITAIPKADLLLAVPSVANRVTKNVSDPQGTGSTGFIGYTLEGVTNYTAGQTTASKGLIVATDYNFFGSLDQTPVSWAVNGSGVLVPTFNSSTRLTVQNTSVPNSSRQPDGTQNIDGNDDRVASVVYQVGDLIYVVKGLSVNSSGTAANPSGSTTDAVRISVLRDSTGAVVTEKTYFNTGFDYTYPSLAVNAQGDMLIGFTRSSLTQGSGATNGNLGAYAVYAHIDPNNPTAGITFGQELQLKAGTVNNYHGPGARWGDFSATNVDPTNPTSFWTTQEFAGGTSTWSTQMSQVWVSPRITGVTSTAADGTYGAGAVIPVTVTFNDAVTVTGNPQLALNAGGGAAATYVSGSGTNTMTFNYTVASGQSSADLDYTSTTALTLSGGTIVDTASALAADLTLAAPGAVGSLGASKNIVVDASVTHVTAVSSPTPNGLYGAGATIDITVQFSRSVVVDTTGGTPTLALNSHSGRTAAYLSGSGTTTLTFRYTVQGGDSTGGQDLDYTSSSALTLNGGTIQDAGNGSSANLALPAPGTAGSLGANKNIVIDALPAQASSVTSTATDGTYGFAAAIPIQVVFTKPVVVDTTGGNPTLPLNSSGTAVYSGGDGTFTVLAFTYVVGAGDVSSNLDYLNANGLTVPAGTTITDQASGLPAVLTLPAPGTAGSLGANKNIVIDALPAQASGVTSPTTDGTYGFGAVIPIQIAFTKPVVVDTTGGSPTLPLNSGGTATYTGGSGTATLTFTYTVGAGDLSSDLDYLATNSLTVPSGSSITDQASGVPAVLTLPAPGAAGSLGADKDIAIDALPAQATSVTSLTANGTYQFGANITVTVSFTKPVAVNTTGGNPTLVLNSGGMAVYNAGNGTFTTLTFVYTVGLGDVSPDLDYVSAGSLTVPAGSSINDQASGVPAVLALPAPGAAGSLGANKNIVINGLPATPSNVTSALANGQYGTGTVVPITVTFTKSVDVTGAPQLALNTGRSATYTSGSGTTTLTFTYTVQGGDMSADLDYTSTTALTLNGGTIQDHASNTPAPLTLPAPGAVGSLGANKSIVVDTTGPKVVQFRVLFGTRSFDLLSSTRFDVPWKITAIQVVFDSPVMTGNVHSLTGVSTNRLTGLKTKTLTWQLSSPLVLGAFTATLASTGANALKNGAGNAIVPFTHGLNVLWGDFNDDHVVDALDEAGVRAAQAGPFQPGGTGYNLFADLSGDGIVNLVDVGITRSRKGTTLP